MPETSNQIMTPYCKTMCAVLVLGIVLAVYGNPLTRGFGELVVAYAIWNLVVCVPGAVSKRLQGRNRAFFMVAAALLLPMLLSLYFLQEAVAFDPWSSLLYFADWYALLPVVIIGYLSMAAGHTLVDKQHPVTGLLIAACLLFVPMYLAFYGIDLRLDDDGTTYAGPPDNVVLRAKQRAGYDFVVYWLYIVISYSGIVYGVLKR